MPSATHDSDVEPAIELSGVEKRFHDGLHAVGPIDLRIGHGEFVAFVGPSGCGKSTALRMIAGLTSPSAGTINHRASPADQTEGGDPSSDLGFVFQEPTLLPWSKVWDNVYLPLRLRGQSRTTAKEAVDAALRQVGLSEFAKAYPRQLSGGMKMRASIARALVTHPQRLLMDEPFAALDEQTRFRLNDDLLRLWEAGRWTVVFVTHSVYEAVYLAQRVLVMGARPGRVVAEVAIDTQQPRDESFRRSAEYGQRCLEVSEALAGVAR